MVGLVYLGRIRPQEAKPSDFRFRYGKLNFVLVNIESYIFMVLVFIVVLAALGRNRFPYFLVLLVVAFVKIGLIIVVATLGVRTVDHFVLVAEVRVVRVIADFIESVLVARVLKVDSDFVF